MARAMSDSQKTAFKEKALFLEELAKQVCLFSEGCFVRVPVATNHIVLPGAWISQDL